MSEPPAVMPDQRFAFVMNVLEMVDLQTFELAPGNVLRRANGDEVGEIRKILRAGWLAGSEGTDLWERPWPDPGGPVDLLHPNEWRYFVIAFQSSSVEMQTIQDACDIAPIGLELGFTFVRLMSGLRSMHHEHARAFSALESARVPNKTFFQRVTRAHLEHISSLRTLIQNDQSRMNVRAIARKIGDVKALPHESPLRVLGFFAILESILTHPPNKMDPYDSITRQIKKKLKLLNRRMEIPIDYSSFKQRDTEKIWGAMYDYRSQIAHGATVDFKDGRFKILGDHQRVLTLIHETVRALARQALREPQLLMDLRDC